MDVRDDNEVNLKSDESVVLDKLYGPLIFAALRCTPVSQTCEWVIERQAIDSGAWAEVARIPGQLDHEFQES